MNFVSNRAVSSISSSKYGTIMCLCYAVIAGVIDSKPDAGPGMDWIAQSVEQCTRNAKVVSSNLTSVHSLVVHLLNCGRCAIMRDGTIFIELLKKIIFFGTLGISQTYGKC